MIPEVVFDVEADSLNPTKIHCLTKQEEGVARTTSNYDNMRNLLSRDIILIGHNIIRWDIPHLERLLGIKVRAKLVDTLALSWYLEPKRVLHGLESYGEEFGVPKPPITDWENLTLEEYKHRCNEDVKINTLLWKRQKKHLMLLYKDEELMWKFIDYLMFKMDCAREQERSRWKLDTHRCSEGLEQLSKDKEEKIGALAKAMPKVPVKAVKSFPKKPYKKCGELSAQGVKWFEFLAEHNLPENHRDDVEYVKDYKEPNPGSTIQVKAWLYSLGWTPATFKFVRDKETNDTRMIEQVNLRDGGGICPSIKRLYGKEPLLELLDGLAVLTHRISILKGFLTNVDEDGYVQACIQGLTNTLRFKHKVCVNLPGVDKAYGELIRGCLMAPEGYELCGSDMAALEDRSKQHFMWPHDPEYVTKMMEPGYCPHVDIAVLAGMLTPEQEERHRTGNFFGPEDKKEIKAKRKGAKPVNYGGLYGQQPLGLSRETGMPLKQAQVLYDIYWKRNWSVKAIAEGLTVKTCKGQKWLLNPVSGFWYSLRKDADRFSTLNQGTGVYCFDTWVKHIFKLRKQLVATFHDEVVLCVKRGNRDKCNKMLRTAIENTNRELQLNRELDIDVQYGDNYSQIH